LRILVAESAVRPAAVAPKALVAAFEMASLARIVGDIDGGKFNSVNTTRVVVLTGEKLGLTSRTARHYTERLTQAGER
jgi:hypothetical protein